MTIQSEEMLSRASGRLVQFYDCAADLTATAGSFLSEGVLAGEVAVVLATEALLDAFEHHRATAGIDVTDARKSGTLVLLDAAATLSRFVSGGRVALLWDAGYVPAAIEPFLHPAGRN